MKKDPKLLLIVLQGFIILVLLISLVYQGSEAQPASDSEQLEHHVERTISDSLQNIISEMRNLGGIPPLLDSYQVERLKKLGLKNPVEDLRNDLMGEDAMISGKGIHGGKMGFYMPQAIHVLNDRWVVAYFEDGHIAGALFLKYSIMDGKISWEVLDEIQF